MRRQVFARSIVRCLVGIAALGCSDGSQTTDSLLTGAGTGGSAGAAATAGSAGAGTGGAGTSGTAGTTPTGGMPAGGMMGVAGTPAGSGGNGGGLSGGTGGSAGMGGSAGADMMAGTGGAAPMGGTLPPVMSTAEDGPFDVTVDEDGGANSWVFHPTTMGENGLKHPIFVWGTGATSVPSQYMDHFTRMASHGFVIISPNNPSVTAQALKASLDWILMENERSGSPFYQKLDATKIAMGGHSLGSVATFNQEQMEMRLTTTIHIAGGSMDGMGSSKVKTPTAYICGDTDIARTNCERDFDRVEDQPT